jgi:hypothetical protein
LRSVRPKTGDKRKSRQPLKLDRAPELLRDRVMKERAAGRTWMEIEEMSPRFEEWEKTPAEIQTQFPGKRLPHSTLQRWHDLRVEQVKREMLADQTRAREIAALFAENKFQDLPEAVRNALGDKIFELMQSADEKNKGKTVKGLLEFGWLLAQQRKLELQERKQNVDERALEIKLQLINEKVKQLKKDVDVSGKKKQLTPEELKQRVDEIYGLGA